MKNLIYFLLILSLFIQQVSKAQEIKINELMSSNSMTIADEDGDFSDWIEIYNSGSSPVDLFGYGISDDNNNLFKWRFPENTLQPKEFLILWASGKDKINDSSIHVNFRLNAAGETLILTHPDGNILDQINEIRIPTDVSFGRADQSEEFVFFSIPTPGLPNHEKGYGEIINPPVFSHEGGFYASPFNVTIASSDPAATIIYTLDGSVPDPENISGTTYYYRNQYPQLEGDPFGDLIKGSYRSYTYSDPINIYNRSEDPDKITRISSTTHKVPYYIPDNPVFKGTTLKARVVKPGAFPSKIITNTYFIDDKGYNRFSLPVISLSVQEDALFDYEKGIYVAGKSFDDWREEDQTLPETFENKANYFRSGMEWEVPAHIELFEGSKGRVLSQGVGIRIHGGATRTLPAKSFRLYARNLYDAPQLMYQFFQDKPYLKYKTILLRNSGNDWRFTMMRDAAIHSIVGHLNFETMAYQPAVLFINSEYWGIHNIRERYDKYYFERAYGVDPENIDILEGEMIPDEGDADHYIETLEYIKDNGLNNKEHYDFIKTRIDINNFIDYQIAQIFIGNSDWPGNNIKYWRLKTDRYDSLAPPGQDGRWRWILYDTDYGFNLSRSNLEIDMLAYATKSNGKHPNPPWSTFLFREFLKNESFKNDFINRFSDQLNSGFKTSVMVEKLSGINKVIEPEIEEHIKRWKHPSTKESWLNYVRVLYDFAEKRPQIQKEHLKNYFKLEGEIILKVDVSDPKQGVVKVNSLLLHPDTEGIPQNVYPWSGSYFSGIPLEIEAIPAPGFVFVGWTGSVNTFVKKITISPNENVSIKALFIPEVPNLIHYWNFNNEAYFHLPTYTIGNASLEINKGENAVTELMMGEGNGFTGANNLLNDVAGSHLKVNDPLLSEIIFGIPTTGFSDIIMKFEAKRSAKGAGILVVEYTLDGIRFIEKQRNILYEKATLYSIDFTTEKLASFNGKFGVKFRFEQGEGWQGGNIRFDNISVESNPNDPVLSVQEKEPLDISLEIFPNPFEHESTIRIKVPDAGKVNIVMQDLQGKILHEIHAYELIAGINNISFKPNRVSGGIYLVNFYFENFTTTYKLIKL